MAHRRSSPDGRHRATGWSAVAAVVAMAAVFVAALPVGAEEASDLAEARAAAEEATQRFADAEADLGQLETDLDRIREERDRARSERDGLVDTVRDIAVDRYTVGDETSLLLADDLNERARADALTRIVTQSDTDAVDRFRAVTADLDHADDELAQKKNEQQEALERLAEERESLAGEIERLEELEQQRIEAELRRAQEEAERQAREAAAAATTTQSEEATEVAAGAPTTAGGTDPGSPGGPGVTTATSTPGGPPPTTIPPPPPAPPPPSGGMACPVPGAAFVDTWGAPRSGGRRHLGVDMMASTGTPIRAPVSGTVTHRSVTTGGLSFFLAGSDGRVYFGTHLSSYGQGGSVSAGTVIGYVGMTGNASTPHLHLEIQIGGQPVNPYPYVRAAC